MNDLVDLVDVVLDRSDADEAGEPVSGRVRRIFTDQGQRAAWLGQTDIVALPTHRDAGRLLAERAHSVASALERDQVLVISGFEGANVERHVDAVVAQLLATSPLQQDVQAAETLLKAFGCANTTSQKSSARYASLREFGLDSEGRVTSYGIMTTTLEAERVASLGNRDEHAFDIFYYLIAGVSRHERESLHIQAEPSDYLLVGETGAKRDALDDVEGFVRLQAAFDKLDFKPAQTQGIFRILSAILLLGNVRFNNLSEPHDSAATPSDPDLFGHIADLLGMDASELEQALVNKLSWTGRELVSALLDSSQALAHGRRFAAALYEMLFTFVIEKANYKLMSTHPLTTIAVIDVPLPRSSFAKAASHHDFVCNLGGDRVENAVRRAVFGENDRPGQSLQPKSAETSEQRRAGAITSAEKLFSNGETLEAIKKSAMAVSHAHQDSDAALLARLQSASRSCAQLDVDAARLQFTVRHFHGPVTYDTKGFMASESSLVDLQWVDLLRRSGNAFISKLWSGPGLACDLHPSDSHAVIQAQVSTLPLRQSMLESPRTIDEERTASFSSQADATFSSWVSALAKDNIWRLICLEIDASGRRTKDAQMIGVQIEAFALDALIQVKAQHSAVGFTRADFELRYGSLAEVGETLGTSSSIGEKHVSLSFDDWQKLEACRTTCAPDDNLSEAQQVARDAMDPFASRRSLPALPAGPQDGLHDAAAWYDDEKPPGAGEPFSAFGTKKASPKVVEEVETSRSRRLWVALVWALTWWIPSFLLTHVGRMKRPDVRMAWREKVALCILIFFFCGLVIFYIIIFGKLLCPNMDKAWNVKEVSYHAGTNDYYVAVRGVVYDLTKFYRTQHSDIAGMDTTSDLMLQLAGQDLTDYFPLPLDAACPQLELDPALTLVHKNFTPAVPNAVHTSGRLALSPESALYNRNWYWNDFLPRMRHMAKGPLVWTRAAVSDEASKTGRRWAIYNGRLYDLENYWSTIETYSTNPAYKFLSTDLANLWQSSPGADITSAFQALDLNATTMKANFDCISTLFYSGELDFRRSPKCQVQPYLLLAFSIIICLVMLSKFLASLQLSSKRMPELRDKFVICQVPCYTEGEDSLRKTIDSLATLTYERKLIFIICDGMIVGSGNDRPTPEIVLDILGADRRYDPEPLAFKSVAEGSKQVNFGKVWSGLYQVEGHVVPYLVVAKVGKPTERFRPGNRGKRDSQVLAMRFLNRAHNGSDMYPLELEMMHQCKNIIGVDPRVYEYMLVIDADTSVEPDSLNRLVSSCIDDSKIIGICGETKLENEKKTWWTMIQVYEYYISQFMAKAFESLFGSVTCLPGCFTMYRLRTSDGQKSLLVHSLIVDDYSENNLDTLHKKNLLALGEDRYLTTLILKHFPTYKTKFNGEARALTLAPDNLSVLVSQRRRWINSTVHNLLELVTLSDLCGFCCFSMRFVVMLDLVGTLILPATFAYLVYLIVLVSTGGVSIPSITLALGMIAAVYGLQAIVFLIRRQWQFIGWLVIYLIAYPIYSFILPIYAFWRFDDFTWGQTRVVVGEGKSKKIVSSEDEVFDESSLVKRSFTTFENELLKGGDRDRQSLSMTTKTQLEMPARPFAVTPNPSIKSGHSYSPSYLSTPAGSPGPHLSTMPSPRSPLRDSRISFNYSPPLPAVRSFGALNDARRASFAPSVPNDYFGSPSRRDSAQSNPFLTPPIDASFSTQLQRMPSTEELVRSLKAFLATQDLMAVTKRSVREALSRMFPNAGLSDRKDEINGLIEGILEGRL